MAASAPEHVVLVTGGSQGIGEAISRRLARAGAAVIIASRRRDACAALAAAIRAEGGQAWPLELDVAEDRSAQRAVAEAREIAPGPIDWLVNNAGIVKSAPLAPRQASADELARWHLEVNYHGARRLVELLLPELLERGYGRIVNVASSAGLRGYAYVSAYCASKFALVGYTLAAADELQDTGVTVNAVAPHYVDTAMLADSIARIVDMTGMSADDARDFCRRQNPGGRIVTAAEVAGAVAELLLGDATGTIVELDGSPEATILRPNTRAGSRSGAEQEASG